MTYWHSRMAFLYELLALFKPSSHFSAISTDVRFLWSTVLISSCSSVQWFRNMQHKICNISYASSFINQNIKFWPVPRFATFSRSSKFSDSRFSTRFVKPRISDLWSCDKQFWFIFYTTYWNSDLKVSIIKLRSFIFSVLENWFQIKKQIEQSRNW